MKSVLLFFVGFLFTFLPMMGFAYHLIPQNFFYIVVAVYGLTLAVLIVFEENDFLVPLGAGLLAGLVIGIIWSGLYHKWGIGA
ncbi:MAG TPA: hypothetical protein PLE74_11770 [Candidatus Cloacimonadota bacterium]|nr:hypothetical protein [Candidatus Cloacimonadota bacterium]HPT72942.1 hypothetical protein [Candidatus Cloacimonadota bacterium]